MKFILMTALGILLPIFIILMTGCMKTPEINKDFGAQNTIEQVSNALENAEWEAKKDTINRIKLGEFAYTVKTNQVENLFPFVFMQTANTVTSRDSNTNRVKYMVTHQETKLDEGGQLKPNPPTQETVCIEYKPDGCSETMSFLQGLQKLFGKIKNLAKIFDIFSVHFMTSSVALTTEELTSQYGLSEKMPADLNWKNISARSEEAPTTWTFHNLQVTRSSFPTPELVLLRSDCGKRDLKNKKCEDPLETIEVSYDQVDWTTEKYPVKYSFRYVFSKEAPFFSSYSRDNFHFGSQIQKCISTTIPYQNQRVALMQCETVKDFTFGHD